MLLGGSRLQNLIGTVILNGDAARVGVVTYDLATYGFYTKNESKLDKFDLDPGCSVFVGSVELVELPLNLACRVLIKNSRLREGLSLDAPLYFPGHRTRLFWRLTNLSSSIIRLDSDMMFAQAAFEEVDMGDNQDNEGYQGVYQDEFDWRGLGDYESVYSKSLREMEEGTRTVKTIEKSLYDRVLMLMGIFVGIFSLVNVNLTSVMTNLTFQRIIAVNLSTVGTLTVLFLLIAVITRTKGKTAVFMGAVSAIAFMLSCLFGFI